MHRTPAAQSERGVRHNEHVLAWLLQLSMRESQARLAALGVGHPSFWVPVSVGSAVLS